MGNTLPVSVTLDKPQARYYPGEVLSGKMTLNIDDPFQYSQLRVRVSADIYTQWYQSGGKNRSGHMVYVHTLVPQIMDMSLNLTSAPGVLQKGVNEFPFRLQLPADALPSGVFGEGTRWGGLVYVVQPQVMLPGSQTWEPEIDSNCGYDRKHTYPDNSAAAGARPSFHILGAAHPGHLATPVPVRSNQDSNRTACCCCMCCCAVGATQDFFEQLVDPDACCSCCVSEKGGFRLNVASDKSVLILDHGETFTLTVDIDATEMDIDFVEIALTVKAETTVSFIRGWGAIPDPSNPSRRIFTRVHDIHSEQVPDSEVKKGSRRQLQYTFTVPPHNPNLPNISGDNRSLDVFAVAPCSAENPLISFKYSFSVRPSVGGCCTVAQSTQLPLKLVAHTVQQNIAPASPPLPAAGGGGGYDFMPPSENPPPPAFGAMFGATS